MVNLFFALDYKIKMNFPSKTIENAVIEISKLPGIGKKTALRLALHLLKQESLLVQNQIGRAHV